MSITINSFPANFSSNFVSRDRMVAAFENLLNELKGKVAAKQSQIGGATPASDNDPLGIR